MADLMEIKTALQEAAANNAEVLVKLDAVLARLGDLEGGATPAEIAEVLALANEVKGGVQSTEDKLDAVPLPPVIPPTT